MPEMLALLPLLVTAGTTAVTGYELSQGGGGGSVAKEQKQLEQAKADQAKADAEAKRKAILASLSNAQEQSGGSLESPSLVNLASIIAGLPGEGTTGAGRGALAQYLGTPPATAPGETLASATFGLSGSQG